MARLRRTQRMEAMDCLHLPSGGLTTLLSSAGIPEERLNAYNASLWEAGPYRMCAIDDTNWVVLRWPTPAMAQQAGMSTRAKFENFYFDVCNLDYGVMSRGHGCPYSDLLNRTDRVRLVGPGTDLTFSIRGHSGSVKCDGACETSRTGRSTPRRCGTASTATITFNTPSVRGADSRYENIRLTFKDGKIVDCGSQRYRAA